MPDHVVSNRPYIEVDSERPEMANTLLQSLEMSESLNNPVQIELRFSNAAHHAGTGMAFAFEYAETESLPLGKAFRVLFPSLDSSETNRTPREIFSGRVSALEFVMSKMGQPELIVQAEDALMAWRMRRRTRQFDQVTVAEMLRELAKGDALAGPVIDYLNDFVATRHQVNESDLAFLQRLLSEHDAAAQVVDGSLHIGPRAAMHRGDVRLELGEGLTAIHVSADLAHQRSAISLSGWDTVAGEPFSVEAQLDGLGPGEGRTSAAYLEPFGKTSDHISGSGVPDQISATALVGAYGAQVARGFVTARGQAVGNPALRVGTHLTLEGIGPRFSNTYFVVSTRHMFDAQSGYITEFEAQCPHFNGGLEP